MKYFVRFRLLGILFSLISFVVLAGEGEPGTDEKQSQKEQLSQEEQAWLMQSMASWKAIEQKKGKVDIANGIASLTIPQNFFFINGEDANKVLVDIWGNPPGMPVLGMIFPEGATPFDPESWAVTVEYSEEGYVSDDDADDIDYDDLLADMQASTIEDSQQRVAQGYQPIRLVGWAKQPFYDAAAHKLHWAKEIQFGDSKENTLNYNIRVLGRKGVLVLNFISGMSQLDNINSHLDEVVAMANFNAGSTYAEFDPDIDKVAAYGIGALVAGKVIAKTGLLAGLLLILKKFGVFIVVGLVAFFKKLFGGKSS